MARRSASRRSIAVSGGGTTATGVTGAAAEVRAAQPCTQIARATRALARRAGDRRDTARRALLQWCGRWRHEIRERLEDVAVRSRVQLGHRWLAVAARKRIRTGLGCPHTLELPLIEAHGHDELGLVESGLILGPGEGLCAQVRQLAEQVLHLGRV